MPERRTPDGIFGPDVAEAYLTEYNKHPTDDFLKPEVSYLIHPDKIGNINCGTVKVHPGTKGNNRSAALR